MKNFLKIAEGVDVRQLAIELHEHPELWNVDIERLHENSPHKDSDDIWVRYRDKTDFLSGEKPWIEFNNDHDSVWYPAYYCLPSLRKIIFDLMHLVSGERLGGVLIWRVKPGHEIYPHKDGGWHAGYYSKFNVCINGSDGASFLWQDHNEELLERTGDVHLFVNSETHAVKNNGIEDYIVLCVCIKTHDYESRFKRTGE